MNYTTLLEKLRISQSFTIELHMNREDFVRKLKYKVDEKEVSSFFDVPIALFSTGSKDFKGQVSRLLMISRFFKGMTIGFYTNITNKVYKKSD